MKTNPEFDNFTLFMDKLAQVPNSEVKAALETEKAEKALRKASRSKTGGRAIFTRPGATNPLVQAVNAVTERERRRKIN